MIQSLNKRVVLTRCAIVAPDDTACFFSSENKLRMLQSFCLSARIFFLLFKGATLKLFAFFRTRAFILVCKGFFFFYLPRPMEIYSSLCNMQLFSHTFKNKFHDVNYKKCISCEFPAASTLKKLLSIGCSIHIYYYEWNMFVFMAS